MSGADLEALRREVALLRAVLVAKCPANRPGARAVPGVHLGGEHVWDLSGFCFGCGLYVPEYRRKGPGYPTRRWENERVVLVGGFPFLLREPLPDSLDGAPPGTEFSLVGAQLRASAWPEGEWPAFEDERMALYAFVQTSWGAAWGSGIRPVHVATAWRSDVLAVVERVERNADPANLRFPVVTLLACRVAP